MTRLKTAHIANADRQAPTARASSEPSEERTDAWAVCNRACVMPHLRAIDVSTRPADRSRTYHALAGKPAMKPCHHALAIPRLGLGKAIGGPAARRLRGGAGPGGSAGLRPGVRNAPVRPARLR